MKLERRTLLRTGGAFAALSLPLSLLWQRAGRTSSRASDESAPGSLLRDTHGVCDLPRGFAYTVLERTPGTLSDGYRLPGLPDGMGCFPGPNGTLVLMRNHELDRDGRLGPFSGAPPPNVYDASAFGCVTRLVVDATSLERVSSNLVLAGTLRNCAGGESPWGWLSCEESTATQHGYVFLCSPNSEQLAPPRLLRGYGRFNHEAVCIDPTTHVAYLTEDRTDGCLYRFVPVDRSRPFEGQLQALRLRDTPRFDTGFRLAPGQSRVVDWVPISRPDPPRDSVRYEAHDRGAAMVRRGEGIWYHDGSVYFAATSGGSRGMGQIFRLTLGRGSAVDRIEVLAESTDSALLDCPDNITVAPWGDVYLAEDGSGEQYVRGLTAEGRIFNVARNAHSTGEFAGVCFSPDGSALFVNLQREGLTLAIRGPFQRLGVA